MRRPSFIAGLLRLSLNLGGAVLLFYGLNLAIVSPTLMKLVDFGPLGEDAQYSAFAWKFGLVSLLSGLGGLYFANVKRVPILSSPHIENGAAQPSKTIEWAGIAGMVFVCALLLSRVASLPRSSGSEEPSLGGPVAFVILMVVAAQGLALFGFVFNTLAHLWLVRFPSERGATLALSSACVQTGVVAAAVALSDIVRRGLESLSTQPGQLAASPEALTTAQVMFVISLLIVAWSRRRQTSSEARNQA